MPPSPATRGSASGDVAAQHRARSRRQSGAAALLLRRQGAAGGRRSCRSDCSPAFETVRAAAAAGGRRCRRAGGGIRARHGRRRRRAIRGCRRLWVREVLCEGGALRELLLSRIAPLIPQAMAARFAAAQQARRHQSATRSAAAGGVAGRTDVVSRRLARRSGGRCSRPTISMPTRCATTPSPCSTAGLALT